jgi:4-amino-4-deoxy-L-arabinose transferase-like glycosyltransferase
VLWLSQEVNGLTRTHAALVGLALTSAWLLFAGLGQRDLTSSHEARAAQNAARMLQTGEWLLPRLFDERPDYQKPPLYYWLVAGLGWLFGQVDAWAVRLPAALAALALVSLVWWHLHQQGRPAAALIAACLLILMVGFVGLGRVGRIDMPLALAISLTLGAAMRGRVVAAAVAAAVAVLLKGPIGLVLPGAVLLAMRGLTGQPRLHCWQWLGGVAVVVGLAGPWFVAAHCVSAGEFSRVFFGHHHLARALPAEADAPHAGTHYPIWYYLPVLVWLSAPASLLLLAGVVIGWRTLGGLAGWRRVWADDATVRLAVVWLVVMLGLLSLARFKRADYLLPLLPALALLGGALGERFVQQWSGRCQRWAWGVLAGAVVVCVAGWSIYRFTHETQHDADRSLHHFAAAIRQHTAGLVLFFRVEDHTLAFHLGRPLNTFLEWENLDIWAGRPGTHYIVMPADCARDWPAHLTQGQLVELIRYDGPRPLVLVRTMPGKHHEPANHEHRRACRGRECSLADP